MVDDFVGQLTNHIVYVSIQLLLLYNYIKTHIGVNYNKLYINNESFHKYIDTIHVNSYYLKKMVLSYIG